MVIFMGLYPRLALTGIIQKKRTYFPYILTCIGMIMITYIITYLSEGEYIAKSIYAAEYVQFVLRFGVGVMVVFSFIFLSYTNSFLIKNRIPEFGLYNILGMSKSNIRKLMFWETLFIFIISSAAGLFCGAFFSKLAELLLAKILGNEPPKIFDISASGFIITLIAFAAIFVLILFRSLINVSKAKPIELLHSESAGEVPPKSNIPAAVIGSLLLIGAYTIALMVKNPISAMLILFIAVIMVIIATYILFSAGSVVLCRTLKANKSYFYKTNHFISVSQMMFRMKKNGAGLASICILSTMVLVTISATTCLYVGGEDMLKERFPVDFCLNIMMKDETAAAKHIDKIIDIAQKTVADENKTVTDEWSFSYYPRSAIPSLSEGVLDLSAVTDDDDYADAYSVTIMREEEYNAVTGETLQLKGDETAVFFDKEAPAKINIGKVSFNVKKALESFPYISSTDINSDMSVILVFSDRKTAERIALDKSIFPNQSPMYYVNSFNVSGDKDDQEQLTLDMRHNVTEYLEADEETPYTHIISRADSSAAMSGLYGGLFFLGSLLGLVFVAAAVLIMYYKQISEGIEDKKRYRILRNVGMSEREIHSTINSQVLTVFFAPLIAAGIHTCFAFPLISNALRLFGLTNIKLFAFTSLAAFSAFSVAYTAVYFMTSRSYFNIVSKE